MPDKPQFVDLEGDRIPSPPSSFFNRLIKDPLLHFLLLAGLLFLAQILFAKEDRDTIVVAASTQSFLFEKEEELLLRPLTDQERSDIVRNFIEEEILVREATKRGFSDSSRIRALLLQNMRFFISGDLPEPTDADLKAFYEENLPLFTSPPSFDLQHVMFQAGTLPPADMLEQLNNSPDPTALGDQDTTFGHTLRFMDQQRLVRSFGSQGAKDALQVLAEGGTWQGPFTAPVGSNHYLRVIKEHPPRRPSLEQARDWVAAQWLAAKSRQLMEEEIDRVRPGYLINVEPLEGARDGG
ncbi:peptidyl-prolyl cis-trans isomerase [Rhodovibrionaceae bacterium A322]